MLHDALRGRVDPGEHCMGTHKTAAQRGRIFWVNKAAAQRLVDSNDCDDGCVPF